MRNLSNMLRSANSLLRRANETLTEEIRKAREEHKNNKDVLRMIDVVCLCHRRHTLREISEVTLRNLVKEDLDNVVDLVELVLLCTTTQARMFELVERNKGR